MLIFQWDILFTKRFALMWDKVEWMGHPLRLELTLKGLLVELANHYTTRGRYSMILRYQSFHLFIIPVKTLDFFRVVLVIYALLFSDRNIKMAFITSKRLKYYVDKVGEHVETVKIVSWRYS